MRKTWSVAKRDALIIRQFFAASAGPETPAKCAEKFDGFGHLEVEYPPKARPGFNGVARSISSASAGRKNFPGNPSVVLDSLSRDERPSGVSLKINDISPEGGETRNEKTPGRRYNVESSRRWFSRVRKNRWEIACRRGPLFLDACVYGSNKIKD